MVKLFDLGVYRRTGSLKTAERLPWEIGPEDGKLVIGRFCQTNVEPLVTFHFLAPEPIDVSR